MNRVFEQHLHALNVAIDTEELLDALTECIISIYANRKNLWLKSTESSESKCSHGAFSSSVLLLLRVHTEPAR